MVGPHSRLGEMLGGSLSEKTSSTLQNFSSEFDPPYV